MPSMVNNWLQRLELGYIPHARVLEIASSWSLYVQAWPTKHKKCRSGAIEI